MAARPHRCAHARGLAPPTEILLTSTDDALHVVRLALGSRPGRVVLLPLDRHHRGVRALCVDHVPHDDAVLEVVDLTLAAQAEVGGPAAALVVGSRRPGPLGWPSTHDWWCYAAMAERCGAAGLALLDWFLVGDHGGLSMAELDSRPEGRWAAP